MTKINNKILYIIGNTQQALYKIGVTNDLSSRLKSLSTGNPYKLSIINYIEGDVNIISKLEKQLHHKYMECQTEARNEWFIFDNITLKKINKKLLKIENKLEDKDNKQQKYNQSVNIYKFEDWSEDLRKMFIQLNINQVIDLIGIKKSELYTYYLNNNFGNRTLDSFVNEFNQHNLTFSRLTFRKNHKKFNSTYCLKPMDKFMTKKILDNMKNNLFINVYDKNTNKINKVLYGSTKESVKNYSLNNIINKK